MTREGEGERRAKITDGMEKNQNKTTNRTYHQWVEIKGSVVLLTTGLSFDEMVER